MLVTVSNRATSAPAIGRKEMPSLPTATTTMRLRSGKINT